MKREITAMRVASIGCVLMLAVIAVFVFFTPTEQFIDYLTWAGSLVGGKTTVGTFMLAALPTLTAFIFYFLWKWLNK